MSHLIIAGIDKVFTPDAGMFAETWHGLHTPIVGGILADGSNIGEVFCPIVQCGLKPDFDAAVSTVADDLKEDCDLSQFKLILADCRKGFSGQVHPLHVPKKGYTIAQNRDLFNAMIGAATEVCGKDGFEIATVGTLGGYSQFFVSLAIKGQETFEIGKLANGAKDIYRNFFNLNSSHNGLIGSNRMLSSVRIVCMNTVQMSIADASERGTVAVIKHTANSETLITAKQFAADLQTWLNQSANFKAQLLALREMPMTVAQFQHFAAGIFTNDGSDELSTISFNRLSDLTALFQRGRGNAGETVYDALNAFTEYFTSGNGVGNSKNVKANKRLATANFGRGNEWKLTALQVAIEPQAFADCMKRGEILYADRLLKDSKK